MKAQVLSALAALSMSAAAFASGQTITGDAEAGATKAAVCAACHGVDGNATDPQYPNIAGQHASYIARHLAMFKNGQRENAIMLGFAATLSEQDMADLGAYFAEQAGKPQLADEAFVAKGEALYRGGRAGLPACAACHGMAGQGNPGAMYPAIAHQHAQYTADMLRRFRDGTVYGDKDDPHANIMAQVGKTLSDAEIEALASYIQGLSPAQP
jgi:cytochrome c553